MAYQVVELTLMRHGMTQYNLERRYLGSEDLPLSAEGRAALKPFSEQNFDRYFVSPKKRCLESFAICFPGKQAELLPEWRERHFGFYEGHSYDELKERPGYRLFIGSRGLETTDGVESHADFSERLLAGFDRILADIQGGERILTLVHGGVAMGLCHLLTHEDAYNWQLKNGEALVLKLAVSADSETLLDPVLLAAHPTAKRLALPSGRYVLVLEEYRRA